MAEKIDWEKVKASGKGKQLKMPEGAGKLSDEDMAGVGGGFVETTDKLPTSGAWIQCPRCGESSSDNIKFTDSEYDGTKYKCKMCGCDFIVSSDGYAIDVDDIMVFWKNLLSI